MSQAIYRLGVMGCPQKNPVADEEGYYDLDLGAFNSMNSAGEYYRLTDEVVQLLKQSTGMYESAINGKLYSELGHPVLIGLPTERDKLIRHCTVVEGNTIAHIKEVYMVKENTKNERGDYPIRIRGKVKPFGVHKDMLVESLNTKSMNTAFSLRSLYKEIEAPDGVVIRDVKVLVTWDFVLQNGVSGADKFTSIKKGYEGKSYSEDEFRNLAKEAIALFKNNSGMGGEAAIPDALKRAAGIHSDKLIYW